VLTLYWFYAMRAEITATVTRRRGLDRRAAAAVTLQIEELEAGLDTNPRLIAAVRARFPFDAHLRRSCQV